MAYTLVIDSANVVGRAVVARSLWGEILAAGLPAVSDTLP